MAGLWICLERIVTIVVPSIFISTTRTLRAAVLQDLRSVVQKKNTPATPAHAHPAPVTLVPCPRQKYHRDRAPTAQLRTMDGAAQGDGGALRGMEALRHATRRRAVVSCSVVVTGRGWRTWHISLVGLLFLECLQITDQRRRLLAHAAHPPPSATARHTPTRSRCKAKVTASPCPHQDPAGW